MDDNKGRALIEKEFGNMLLWAIWAMTFIQLALIVIETLDMIWPSFFIFASYPRLKTVKATGASTNIYLFIQFAYTGRKEFSRWLGKTGIIPLKTGNKNLLEEDELVRRLRNGETAVGIWIAAVVIGVTIHAFHFIPQMPAELERTFVQVTGLYALATVISTVQTRRAKKAGSKDAANGAAVPGDPPDDLIEIKNQAANPIIAQQARVAAEQETNTDEEAALLKFIRENKGVRVGECMKHCGMSKNRAYYLLKKLVASGAVKAEGRGKATTYTAL